MIKTSDVTHSKCLLQRDRVDRCIKKYKLLDPQHNHISHEPHHLKNGAPHDLALYSHAMILMFTLI